MSWNGSGQFVRNFSWVNDAANNIPITASRVDADSNDITGNGFGNTLTRDGQGSATANLPMNGFKHTNCAAGVANTDYATMVQISGLAPRNAPTFTGVVTAPTPATSDNSNTVSTTNYVKNNLASYVPSSGGTFFGIIQFNSNIGLAAGLGMGFGTQSNAIIDGGSGVLDIRTGLSGSPHFSAIDASGNYNSSGGFNGTFLTLTSGVITLGGTAQPTIFVQSGTPTARNVGDLWFF